MRCKRKIYYSVRDEIALRWARGIEGKVASIPTTAAQIRHT